MYIIHTIMYEFFNYANVDFISPVKMSEAIYDPYAYTRLNDSIVHQILQSTDENLKEVSRSIVTCLVVYHVTIT